MPPKVQTKEKQKKSTAGKISQIWSIFLDHYFGFFFCSKKLVYLLLIIIVICGGAVALNQGIDYVMAKYYPSSSNSRSPLFKKAEKFYTKNEFRKAIKLYSQAIEENPKDSVTYNNRGLSFFNLEMNKEAILDFDKAIELEPFNPTYYFNRANYHFRKDDKVSAEADFDRAIEILPEFFAALVNRGNLMMNLGRNIEARNDFEKVINNPKAYKDVLIDAYYNRGNINTLEGKIEEAHKDFSYCINEAPTEYVFYLNRGTVSHRNTTYNDAITDFNKSLELSKGQKYDKILNARGMSYMHSNRTEDARKDFQAAIKYNANPDSFLALGLLEKKLSNWNASLEAFSNALFLDKDVFEAHFNKGNVYFQMKFYKKAILAYTEALKIHPGFAAALFNRAKCFETLNMYNPASIDFDAAFEIEPSLKTMNITLVDIQ
eukprot:gene439-6852_t